ncbi:MAG: NDP-sugar synthase [Elusimicrobia bacterium]|nr:NDP-sugar synthase [Elusimicrobiota bacterium]
MKAGIIAAGEGSRLAKSHAGTVKPLIPVAGKPLIHWVVDGLRAAGATSLTVLTNSRGTAVPPSLAASFPAMKFDFVMANTASSFESFRLVSLRLAETEEDFVVSTVDALIRPEDVARFIAECRAAKAVAGLALTLHVDDENPLWADVDANGRVGAIGGDTKRKDAVTCGLYYLTRAATRRFPEAAAHSRLRDFWKELVASGEGVMGITLSKSLDVDRPEDLGAAESFLTTETKR